MKTTILILALLLPTTSSAELIRPLWSLDRDECTVTIDANGSDVANFFFCVRSIDEMFAEYYEAAFHCWCLHYFRELEDGQVIDLSNLEGVDCDLPTEAEGSSWGALKARYR